MRLAPLVFLALFAGCTPADPVVEPGAPPDEPAPYIFEEDDPPVAELSAAELEGAIDAALALVGTLTAAPLFPAYDAAMLGAEETCPAYYDYQGSQYWYDTCTASTGTRFSGYSFYQDYDTYDDGSGVDYSGDAVYGVAQIVTPEGYTYEAGGSASSIVGVDPTYTYWSSAIQGSFAWDGPEAAGTWLESGLSPDITLVAYDAKDYGRYYAIEGGLSGIGGELDTVVFDGVVLFEAGLGSTCPTEPSGVVSVRDALGNWYDVVFDGPPDTATRSDADLCDGCGAAFFRGEPVGDVCVDFTGLLGWEASPW